MRTMTWKCRRLERDNDDEEEAIWRPAREGKSETDIYVLF